MELAYGGEIQKSDKLNDAYRSGMIIIIRKETHLRLIRPVGDTYPFLR